MFKVGDRVKMVEYCRRFEWYTDDCYVVYRINDDRITLDKQIAGYTNIIHIGYVYSIREERKKKLRQICSRLEIE